MPAHKLPSKDYTWNANLAYAIGLITTDGSLSKDKRHIIFTSTDIPLLRTFKKCLSLNNKITISPQGFKSSKQAYRLQFGNVQFYNWLLKIGLFSNKTLTIGKMLIPDKYFPDFIRGHLDGDGSIITYPDRYLTHIKAKYVYKRLIVYLMSASQKHMTWIRERIYKLTGIHGALLIKTRKQRTNPCYVLKFSKKESIILLNWIYYRNKLPYLKRKYLKAKKYLRITIP